MDRSTDIAITLLRMALALLDKTDRPDSAQRVQQAIDLARDVTGQIVSGPPDQR